MEIFCITEWDSRSNMTGSEYYKTIEGIVGYLLSKNPVGNMFAVTDREMAGEYDITADNLLRVIEESRKNNMVASVTIVQDFLVQRVESRYTISKIKVNE